MPQQKGTNSEICIGFETTYKTPPAAGFVMPFNTIGVVGVQARNPRNTMRGNRNQYRPFAGNKDVSGPLVIPVDSIALPYWLHAMFGAAGTTGVGPYVHEYKIQDIMPSFTLEKYFEDLAVNKYERLTGCKVSTFNMVTGGDGELVANLEIMGADFSLENTAFDAAPTTITPAFLENFQASVEEGGGALGNSRELSLSIDFDLDPEQYAIGAQGSRGTLPEGTVNVSGNITTFFEDSSLLDKALASTPSSLKVTVTDGASSIFELECQELLYTPTGVVNETARGLVVNLAFVPYYETGSEASAVVARVTNDIASYSL